jgi:hypothetical protein
MDTEPIIGDRWEKLQHYSGGGQSKVYIVRDLTGEHAGDLVLKQIDNLRDSRDARFRNEVEAAIRLRHENIVPVIAHSDFSKSEGVMYLVMPLAAAGSLNTRVGLYKGQVGSTITVAKGLAAALAHTHSQGVIHRDVKPENILFQAENHRPWLADFGICLLANMPRVTEDREIVGPRLFMAPELEDGGQLNVTCAADLYSLGKVIYFMISGGRVFSREQHRDPSYDLSGESGRHAQIWLLLDRLICPLSDRIRSATDVTERLEKIENFARNSTFSLSPEAKRRIDGIVRKDAVQSAAVQKHQEQERQKAAAFEGFARDVATTTNTALNLFAHEITQEGYITATVIEAGQPKGLPDRWDAAWGGYRQIMPVWVASMRVVRQGMRPPEFFLSLFLAYEAKVTVRVAQPGIPLPPVSSTPDDAILFPIYYQNDGRWGFLIKNQAGIFVPSLEAAAGPQARMLVNLRPNEWPADGDKVRELLQQSVEAFLQYLDTVAATI